MKKYLIIGLLYCFNLYGGDGTCAYSIRYPYIDAQFLHQPCLGLGAAMGYVGAFESRGQSFIVGINPLRKKNEFIMYTRLTVDKSFLIFGVASLSLNHYTDFKNSSIYLAPEVGIGSGTFFIMYSYNIPCIESGLNPVNRHNLIIRFWIDVDRWKNEIHYIKKPKFKITGRT